ncbi:MAG: sialate O-acetylesterase [Verrucomicrobiales bacterium]
MNKHTTIKVAGLLAACTVAMATAVSAHPSPPAANKTPVDQSQPVQVFILLGQSNMLGAGRVTGIDKQGSLEHAAKQRGLYPFLLDQQGQWRERRDVRFVRFMNGKQLANDWMSVRGGKIGPELGIGRQVGDATAAPVMILKSCIGNRSLGWDLLPPGSKPYQSEENGTTYTYAGYRDSPDRWQTGTKPKPIAWVAGKQWDTDIADAKKALADLETYYPGSQRYQVAGFFFWQGDKDRYKTGHATRYEQNLVTFIKALRTEFNAPDAKFVCATLGQSSRETGRANNFL